MFGSRPAAAHRILCEETVNGQRALDLHHYPVTLHYRLTVRNFFQQHTSTATSVTDPVLQALGFKWTPSAPFTLPGGGEHTDTFNLVVHDRAECLRFAHREGESDSVIDDLFTVAFDKGSASCMTTVTCGPETVKLSCEAKATPPQSLAVLAAPATSLGTAASFAVLAGTTVTNTGPTSVAGDVGVSPGTAITGFPPGNVVGTIHSADAIAGHAQSDLTTAYNALAATQCNFDLTGKDLGGLKLTPGVYCFSSAAQLTGALVLDAQGNQSATFIFQIGSKLVTGSNASVLVVNGALPCNVFWQVGSSATLGTGTSFAGNILALTSIALATNASLGGRALARNGAVTMGANRVTAGECSPCAGVLCYGICEAPDAGVCVPVCTGTLCNSGQCIDLLSDPANCGSCGNACRTGDLCVSGACSAPCNGNLCEGRCVHFDSDVQNCGACDHACASTECCTGGSCVAPPR